MPAPAPPAPPPTSSTSPPPPTMSTDDRPDGGDVDDARCAREGARRPVPTTVKSRRFVTRRSRARDDVEEGVEESADARVRRWRSNLATRGARPTSRIAAEVAVGASSASASASASAPIVPTHLAHSTPQQQQQQAREFGLEEVFARVLLPATAAARSLGVSETTFKLRCATTTTTTTTTTRGRPRRARGRSVGGTADSSPGKQRSVGHVAGRDSSVGGCIVFEIF